MRTFWRNKITVLTVGIVTLFSTVFGQKSVNYLSDIQRLNTIFLDSKLEPLPNSKPSVLLIFKSCCSANAVAIRWAVELHQQYGDSLNIIGIAIDNPRTASKMKPWLSSRGVKFPCYWDANREMIKLMGVLTTPSLFVFDRDGNEVYNSRFFNQYDMKQMKIILAKLIKPKTL